MRQEVATAKMELVRLGLGTEMLELPGVTSSHEVSVNAADACEPAHLEKIDGTDRWTHL